jgi:hypothetical protein
LTAPVHPAAPHSLPVFITAPGETDALMVGMGVFLVLAVLGVGLLFLRLHTLPERMAHKAHKLQFEIVAVLGLLSLFTHQHVFWVAGLLLALIDIPDFASPLRRMAGSLEKIAGVKPPPEEILFAPHAPEPDPELVTNDEPARAAAIVVRVGKPGDVKDDSGERPALPSSKTGG